MSMTKTWHSSPTRGASLDAIEERQRARANRLYQPMSSPIKAATNTGQRHKLKEQMQRMRDELRQQRHELGREKTVHDEDLTARLRMLQEQAEMLETDLELLLEEEKAMSESGPHSGGRRSGLTERASAPESGDPKYMEELEEELEDFLAAEELEFAAQLSDLQL